MLNVTLEFNLSSASSEQSGGSSCSSASETQWASRWQAGDLRQLRATIEQAKDASNAFLTGEIEAEKERRKMDKVVVTQSVVGKRSRADEDEDGAEDDEDGDGDVEMQGDDDEEEEVGPAETKKAKVQTGS